MGFLDFLFGKRKQEQPKTQPKAASKTRVPSVQESIAHQSVKPQEKPMSSKPTIPTMEPFVFKSDCHQRFENGNKVMGLQQCSRTVSVEKNTSGCRGYKLNPGEGYIVKVFNDDLGKPNMSDKPMRIVSKTADKIELRGFPIEAQTPFGWQEVDYGDYGFTVYYSNGKVDKCVLHMFDRNVDLEYRKSDSYASNISVFADVATKSKNKQHLEELAQQAMSCLQNGNDGDAVYHPMFKAWREIQQNPSLLKDVQNKALLGNGLFVFISYGTVQDIDDRQQIISLAYLLISDALTKNPKDVNLIRNRILVMLHDKEAFQYTISSATNTSSGFDFMGLSQFESRDALYSMIYSDLAKSTAFTNIPMLNATLRDLERKIDNNFFGQNKSRAAIASDGEKNHAKVLTFLREKVYDNADIDF